MITAKEIVEMYNVSSEAAEVKLYQAMLDLGMDDDGLIAIVVDKMLAAVYNAPVDRKKLAAECYKMTKYILDSGIENAVELTNTPNGYKGTHHMTDAELQETHTLLKQRYNQLRKK
jgi:hypothetical protein